MVLYFRCSFGVKLPLLLSDRFGQRVEIDALEFINAVPIGGDWSPTPNRWPDGRKVFSSGNALPSTTSRGLIGPGEHAASPEPTSGLRRAGSGTAHSRSGSGMERSKCACWAL